MNTERWAAVQAAFDELVALDPSEQAGHLALLASCDPALYQAIESLLAADADASARLAAIEAAFLPGVVAKSADPLGLAGRTISHFLVGAPLGAGGMGVVYRAEDTRLGRSVALKFLTPAYSLDPIAKARFLREAHAAATLDHPNICTIYEVGATDEGWLFIAMALYEGETLKARLASGALSIDDSRQVARQIASGLQAAHSAGIVHRDLKPGNIVLLPDGTVRILDFGLARARDQSVSDSGAIVGTISYMAPEQIRGDSVDARADLWALGIVQFEMLTGRKPFDGELDVTVAHAIVHDAAVSSGDTAPSDVMRVALRLLEKNPADRPQSAAEVLRLLTAVPSSDALRARMLRTVRSGPRPWLRVVLTVSAAVAVAAAWLARPSRAIATTDDRLVAVIPFRVVGADRSLDYLREGIMDLLAAKLNGATRVADPRSVVAGWRAAGGSESREIDRAAALRLGARLGAGEVLLGNITDAAGRIVLNATLVSVNGGASRSTSLEAHHDSIPTLVDRLAIQLLALRAGEHSAEMPGSPATPFTVIRDYLEGQRLARRGQYNLAYERYRSALKADSNFAAAWFGVFDMAWSGAGARAPAMDSAARHLARLRGQLTPAMRAMVDARIGVRYPAMPSLAERRQLAERATEVAPESPYAWQYLGDVLFHWGAAAGVDHADERAIAAFERALALDSSFHTAIDHLPSLYYMRGDTSGTRRWLSAALASDTAEPTAADYFAATFLADKKRAMQWRREGRDNFGKLVTLEFMAVELALPLQPVDSAMTAFANRAVTDTERFWLRWRQAGLAHIRGQPQRAANLLRTVPGILRDDWPTHMYVLESVLAEGDSSLAEKARRTLDPFLADDCVRPYICAWFTAALYDLMRGNSKTARMALDLVRPTSRSACWKGAPTMCSGFALILDARLAASDSRTDARARLVQLDSMLRDAPVQIGPLLEAGNLVAAHLWEAAGDSNRALAATRRRTRFVGFPEFHATYLREEGRLAAATGDREGAIRAYRQYLALRADAEPALQVQVATVRRELARLERGGSGPLQYR